MRYLSILLFTTILYSCGDTQEIEKKRMTVTTNSDEAKELFYQALDTHSGLNWQKAEALLKSALAKDPDFILARVLLNSPFVNNTDRKILNNIYNSKLDGISEMEATYVKGWYEAATGEAESSRETFKTLTTKYSDIPIFWLHSGILKSGQRGGDIKDAISDLEKCLEVNPNSYGANAYLMAKHMVVGTLGRMLPVEERDLEIAKKHIDRMIEIDPNIIHPVNKMSIKEILNSLESKQKIQNKDIILQNPAHSVSINNYSYIAIEGNIGSGKTNLAKKIAEDFNGKLILEAFADNPFLPKFYKESERNALPLELFFMAERFQQLNDKKNTSDLFSKLIVADYSFFKSKLFAQNNLKEDELNLFNRLYDIMFSSVKKPELLIYSSI